MAGCEHRSLGRCRVFRGFSEPALMTLLSLMRKETRAAGDVVFTEGDVGDALFVIDEGRVRLAKNLSGVDVPFVELGPCDVFGEMGVLSDAPRSAAATVVVPTRLLVLSRQRLADIALTDRQAHLLFLENLTAIVGGRLRAATVRLTELLEEQDRAARAKDDVQLRLARSRAVMVDVVTPAGGLPRIVRPA